jgi:hypothetical protein
MNTLIAELTNIYSNLSKRWSNDPCNTDVYQSFRQEEYHEAYKKLKTVNIETVVLEIISKSLDEKILVRLRGLLAENIQIYLARQNEFSNIDFPEVFSLQEERLFADKFALLAKDKEDIKEFPYPTEQERQMLLKENQTEKNLLENERNEYTKANIWMIENFYSLIYDITVSFQEIINSYFPLEKEKEPTKTNPNATTGAYFDMKLVSFIHGECNNIQFENLSELDLYALLNLQSTSAKLVVKSGERERMCYLIFKLYDYLKTDDRQNWRTAILESADIKEDYYQSKYKASVSEVPSKKSKEFAERIGRIFKELS